ncbi:MAG: hypothetical protein IM509_05200 [Microcystis sp. M31BS1]|uniref:hypothetical protein n=1 Tax=Microcystis sp. M31BS1 TaxID=2771186 RepID=UPI0025829B2F|nr:hypothetical protein [Microcystis sp. M31BS1]MCA2590147.1 hypothetical protein [Microcystis sp. M31BS1]
MAFQFSTAARNAALDAIETAAGTAPTLTIRTGSVPANCAATRSGTVLATLVLPSNWLADASGGTKAISGTWQDISADAAGTAAHFSIDQGATCHIQGTVTGTGGGGDMTLDNTSIALGQQVTVTAFTLTAGGA